MGLLLESNIQAAARRAQAGRAAYGVSITDACIGWADTERLLRG